MRSAEGLGRRLSSGTEVRTRDLGRGSRTRAGARGPRTDASARAHGLSTTSHDRDAPRADSEHLPRVGTPPPRTRTRARRTRARRERERGRWRAKRGQKRGQNEGKTRGTQRIARTAPRHVVPGLRVRAPASLVESRRAVVTVPRRREPPRPVRPRARARARGGGGGQRGGSSEMASAAVRRTWRGNADYAAATRTPASSPAAALALGQHLSASVMLARWRRGGRIALSRAAKGRQGGRACSCGRSEAVRSSEPPIASGAFRTGLFALPKQESRGRTAPALRLMPPPPPLFPAALPKERRGRTFTGQASVRGRPHPPAWVSSGS